MPITETTQLAEPRWPRWVWLVAAVLAIVIGGGLGHLVASRAGEATAPRASQPTVTPIVEPPAPPPGSTAAGAAQPDPEIEIEPEPVKPGGSPTVRHPTARPKQKPKPTKSTPCNVYDHMDGC